jgi:hypothetical protein
MLSDYSIQGAAIVNKSCLGNETLEITYQRPKFLTFSGGGIRSCPWMASHTCRSLHLGSYVDIVKYSCFKTNLPVTILSNVKTEPIKWSYLGYFCRRAFTLPQTTNACSTPKKHEGCRSFRFTINRVVKTPPLVFIF